MVVTVDERFIGRGLELDKEIADLIKQLWRDLRVCCDCKRFKEGLA